MNDKKVLYSLDGKNFEALYTDEAVVTPNNSLEEYAEELRKLTLQSYTGSFKVLKTSSVWCNMYNEYYEPFNKTCRDCAANNECIKSKINKKWENN